MGAREPSRKPSRKDETTVVQLDAAFLDRLGERVREARARRGMTRKILARDSGVSERYLAQLESGRGNVSVLLLRQIAQALNLPLDELVRADNGQSVELTLILQLLKRLPAAKLAKVRTQLVREYGSAYGARENRIALVGLRGAGKSTLGSRARPAASASPSSSSTTRSRRKPAPACTRSSCSTGRRASGATSAARSSASSRRTSGA